MRGGLVLDKTGEVAPSAPVDVPLSAVLAMAAVATAAVAQGAYHAGGQIFTGALLAAALATAVVGGGGVRPPHLLRPPVLICGALGAWALVSAALSGSAVAGLPTVLLLVAVAVVALLCRQAGEAVLPGLVLLGVLVALTGLAGVAWRIEPWTLESQGLWRAATTLTYANAAAGLLVPVTLVAAGLRVSRPGSRAAAAATCVLLAGTGATMSRGGGLALALGGAVLASAVGLRPLLRTVGGPAAGAVIALAGLAPSMVVGQPPRPVLALSGLAAGVVLAVATAGADRRRHRLTPVVLLAIAGLLVLSGATSRVLSTDSRVTLSSSDRVNEAAAALRVAAGHPLTGAGPGQASLSWQAADDATLVAKYAHNEYLQVLAELGIVGLALVLALVVSIGRRAVARLAHGADAALAGAAAGLAAVAFHSGMDFLWHVPAIPLVCAVLVGVSCLPREGALE
jgi:hypothetical protein